MYAYFRAEMIFQWPIHTGGGLGGNCWLQSSYSWLQIHFHAGDANVSILGGGGGGGGGDSYIQC